jgi:hypothetical protein
MIRDEKQKNARMAIHGILVWLRLRAYEKAPHDELARVLDGAEELPTLFDQKDDMTDYFRSVLVDLAARHEGLGVALDYFDRDLK